MPLFHLAPLDLRVDVERIHFPTPSALFAFPLEKTTNFHLPQLQLNAQGDFTDPIVAGLRSFPSPITPRKKPVSSQLVPDTIETRPESATIQPQKDSSTRHDTARSFIQLEMPDIETHSSQKLHSWDTLSPDYPSGSSYASPLISEAPASILETIAFKSSDTRFDGLSYTKEQLLLENLSKVILGTESTLFAWDAALDRFAWRSHENGKGKGREGRLVGCTIGDTQLLVESYLALGSAFVRLEAVVKDLTTSTTSNLPTSASHSVANALAGFCTYARQELSLLVTPDSTFLSLSSRFSPLASTLDSLLLHFQRPLSFSPPYAYHIKLSARHLLSNLFDSLDAALKSSAPKLDQVVLAWLFDGVLRGWWRGWEEWVGIESTGERRGGEGWKECGIEVRESVGEPSREQEVLGQETRAHVDAGVEYIFHTSQIPSFFPREVAISLFESGRALRILKRSSSALSVSSALNIGYSVIGSGRGLVWDYQDCLGYHEAVERKVDEIRRMDTSAVIVSAAPTSTLAPAAETTITTAVIPATKYHSEIAALFSLFDVQPGTSPTKTALHDSTAPSHSLVSFLAPLLQHSPAQSILLPETPTLAILLDESLWSPIAPILQLTQSTLLKRLFTQFGLREELSLLGRVWLFSDSRCGAIGANGTDWEGKVGGRGRGGEFLAELEEILFRSEGYKDDPIGGRLLERQRKRDTVISAGTGVAEGGREERGVGLAVRLDWKGSSGVELSLALRECLARVIMGGGVQVDGEVKRGDGRVKEKELIDRLSFAFDFSNAVDPTSGVGYHKDSLKALSFLTLSYDPLSPLNLLVTPKVLKQYSRFFSWILILLRVQKVVGGISRGVRDPLSLPSTTEDGAGNMKKDGAGSTKEDGAGRDARGRGGKRYLFGEEKEARRLLEAFSFTLLTTSKAVLDYFFTFAVSDSIHGFDNSLSTFVSQLFPPPVVIPTTPHSPSSIAPSPHVKSSSKSSPLSTSAEPTLNNLTTIHSRHLKSLSTRLLLERNQSGLLDLIEGIFELVLRFGKFIIDQRRVAESSPKELTGAGGAMKELKEMRAELDRRTKLLVKVLTSLSERGGPSLGRAGSRGSYGGAGGYADELLSRFN